MSNLQFSLRPGDNGRRAKFKPFILHSDFTARL